MNTIINIFPVNQDDYSIEEISYEDMMSILSTQEQVNKKPQLESSDKLKQDDLSQRITENANRQLPDWLINN